jgi:hypothetical protein
MGGWVKPPLAGVMAPGLWVGGPALGTFRHRPFWLGEGPQKTCNQSDPDGSKSMLGRSGVLPTAHFFWRDLLASGDSEISISFRA